MRRRHVLAGLAGAAVWPSLAAAQKADVVRRLGVLMPSAPDDPFGQAIVQAQTKGLEDLGWVADQNLRLEVRWIGGDESRRAACAAELVRLSPDVLFACFQAQLAALVQESRAIPTVFIGVTDPVGQKYVASLAKPGGRITGFTFFEQSMVGKWLGVLKELVPSVTRVAVIVNPETAAGYDFYVGQFKTAAARFQVEPTVLLVRSRPETETAIRSFAARPDSGLIVLPDTFTTLNRELIVELAARHRLPAVYQFREAAVIGGLASYGTDQLEVARRSALYVDRIFRGANPGDLPVEQPTKYELVVNLRTAKALGLTVPVTLLARADEVIE